MIAFVFGVMFFLAIYYYDIAKEEKKKRKEIERDFEYQKSILKDTLKKVEEKK